VNRLRLTCDPRLSLGPSRLAWLLRRGTLSLEPNPRRPCVAIRWRCLCFRITQGGSTVVSEKASLHIKYLRWAELQFLLAHKVNTLTVNSLMLDQPIGWSYGKHWLDRTEMTLSFDDAALASSVLHHSAAFLLAVHIVTAFKESIEKPREAHQPEWKAAFEIARLIRNAYTHSPACPRWSVDPDCSNTTYEVDSVIKLCTSDLQGKELEWTDYGGPIALYRLSEFVRTQVLSSLCATRQTISTTSPLRRSNGL
jgi:hypothetical protein